MEEGTGFGKKGSRGSHKVGFQKINFLSREVVEDHASMEGLKERLDDVLSRGTRVRCF